MRIIFTLFLLIATLPAFTQQTAFQWAQTYSTSYGSSYALALTVDASGNVITTGYFHGTVDFDPGPGVNTMTSAIGDYNIFVTRMDPSGNLDWCVQMGGFLWDAGTAVATDPAGNIYVTGYFAGGCDFDPGPSTHVIAAWGQRDAFVLKLDAAGGFQWARGFYGQGDDEGRSIRVDNAGNVLSTGSIRGETDFDPGTATYTLGPSNSNMYIYISKLDASGNFVWAKEIGGANTNHESRGLDIDPSNNIYIAGFYMGAVDFDPGAGTYVMTSLGGFDSFVLKLDASGNFLFSQSIGGPDLQKATAIRRAPNGDLLVAGFCSGMNIDFDPGTATHSVSAGSFGTDVFVCRLSSAAAFIWVRAMGGHSYEEGYAIDCDASGNVYTTGVFASSNADFDPGAAHYIFSAAPSSDAFISKLDQNGSFVWAKHIGGGQTAVSGGIAVDGSGAVYTCGHFLEEVDFDPGFAVYTYSASSYQAYIHKLEPCVPSETLSLAPGNDLQICSGSAASVTVTSAGTPSWVAGTLATSIISVGNSYTTPTLSPGNYWYYVYSGSVCPAELTVSVSVNPPPVITVINTLVCIGQTIVLEATGAVSYTWSTGSLSATTEIAPLSPGVYTVTGMDANGCIGKTTRSIQGWPCTGVQMNEPDAGNIFPNPFSSAVVVLRGAWSNAAIEVYDVGGRLVTSVKPDGDRTVVNMQDQPAGIYFLRILENGQLRAQQKLLKE